MVKLPTESKKVNGNKNTKPLGFMENMFKKIYICILGNMCLKKKQ